MSGLRSAGYHFYEAVTQADDVDVVGTMIEEYLSYHPGPNIVLCVKMMLGVYKQEAADIWESREHILYQSHAHTTA